MQRFLNLIVLAVIASFPVLAQTPSQGPSAETLNQWVKNAHSSELAISPAEADRKANSRKSTGSRFAGKQGPTITEGAEPQTNYGLGDYPLFMVQTSRGAVQPGEEDSFHLIPIAQTGGYQGSLFSVIWIYDPDGNTTYDYPNLGQGLNILNKVEGLGTFTNVYSWKPRLTDRAGKYWFSFYFFNNNGQLVQQVAADVYLGNTGGFTSYPFIETGKFSSNNPGRTITLSGSFFGQVYVGIGSAVFSNTQILSFYQNWGGDMSFSCPGFGVSSPTFMPVTVFMTVTRTCYTYNSILYR